jgi:hypothetical protein
MNERAPGRDRAIAGLLLFPPGVRTAVLMDAELREQLSLPGDAVIRLGRLAASFRRSRLLAAIRQVLAGAALETTVESEDGLLWQVSFSSAVGVVVRHGTAEVSLPECACLSPQAELRSEWFESETRRFRVTGARIAKWRTVLAARPLNDDELDELLEEFRLTPAHFRASVRDRLSGGSFSAADLVPSDLVYFERLVGEPSEATDVRAFISGTVGAHVRGLVDANPSEGLKAAFLLASHTGLAEVVDLTGLPSEEVAGAFEWLATHGSRISQVGAIECGLRVLPQWPTIAPSVAAMVRTIAGDNPEEPSGRLGLLSSLVTLVEGEFARRGIGRERPPFWRRLASTAHASILEREVVGAAMPVDKVAEWASGAGWSLYYTQSLIDLRLEPRWFPQFILPSQLKAWFVGRIAAAAERYRENVVDEEVKLLLWGSEASSVKSQSASLLALLPGPLEGGIEAADEIAPELEANIRSNLQSEELSPESFSGLVNSSLIFRVGPKLSEMAAEGLRRVGYQLRRVNASGDPSVVLMGLAMVSAVTRSKALADGVRILARLVRRNRPSTLSPQIMAQIAMVGAAAIQDTPGWSGVVGDWLTEIAFIDMSRQEALAFQDDLLTILSVAPILWDTCGRAEAAIASFMASFPNAAGDEQARPE